MTALDLKAIRERADAATKGPWTFHIEDDGDGGPQISAPDPRGDPDCSITVFGEHSRGRDKNVQFITRARADVPALLDLVDEQQRTIEEWREKARAQVRDWFDTHKDQIVRDVGHFNGELEAEVDKQQRTIDAMVGALLAVEWTGRWQDMSASGVACASCGCMKGAPHSAYAETFTRFSGETVRYATPIQACAIDVALSAAGFPDQASRDAERARRSK